MLEGKEQQGRGSGTIQTTPAVPMWRAGARVSERRENALWPPRRVGSGALKPPATQRLQGRFLQPSPPLSGPRSHGRRGATAGQRVVRRGARSGPTPGRAHPREEPTPSLGAQSPGRGSGGANPDTPLTWLGLERSAGDRKKCIRHQAAPA